MALDPAMVADCPYLPEGQLIDDVLEVDMAKSLVVCRMPTHKDLPITRTQRVHPVRHPPHVSGGLMVHATGVVGHAHAYLVLGLRHMEGWLGFGARIHNARFHSVGHLGPPLILKGWATSVRQGSTRVLARYSFEFLQEGRLVYEGDQTALWTRVGNAS